MSVNAWFLDTAVGTGLYGVMAGMFVPAFIARIPEPGAEPREATGQGPGRDPREGPGERTGARPGDEVDAALPGTGPEASATSEPHAVVPEATPGIVAPEVSEPKQLYAEIARLPGLRWRTSLATGVVSALIGARTGWEPQLTFLLFLAPVGVSLAVIDWKTRLLPTKVISPTYFLVAALAVLSALAGGDWSPLGNAAWGWLIAGGTFFVLWFIYPKGMGYGDVRLAGVLGISLGYLGWSELLTGVYAGFLLGGVGGLLLSTLRIVDRKAYPFGPFMLAGALVGILTGPYIAAWYV